MTRSRPDRAPGLLGLRAEGLRLVVHPSGARFSVVRDYTPSGRDRRMKLGAHGELTPDSARKQAADILASIGAGYDPLTEREDQRQVVTFAELVPIYRERHLAKRKPSTASEYERLIEREMLPGFAARMTSLPARSRSGTPPTGARMSPTAHSPSCAACSNVKLQIQSDPLSC